MAKVRSKARRAKALNSIGDGIYSWYCVTCWASMVGFVSEKQAILSARTHEHRDGVVATRKQAKNEEIPWFKRIT